MIFFTEADEFARLIYKIPVVDVRSPGEFLQGHVPGAISFPLFDDAERAEVGKIYTRTGSDHAIIKGLDFALNKVNGWQKKINSEIPKGQVLLYCWRGGMRSATMAEVFHYSGYEVYLLKGGYKAWRRYIRAELEVSRPVKILGGFTGSGKTILLRELSKSGEQVIDIEALACHKGSVFGALGQNPQPTNEQFENEFFFHWNRLDPAKPVWLEDESRMIGNVTMPEPLYRKIISGPLYRIEVDRNIRIENLVREYSGFDQQLLKEAIRKIRLRIGGENYNKAMDSLELSDFHTVADIILAYYDKAYLHALEQRSSDILSVKISGTDLKTDAKKVIKYL